MCVKVNNIDLQVLSLFTKGYNKEHYIREVERLINVSSRTAQLALDRLEKKGVLESETRGKIKSYQIRTSGLSRAYFLLTEHYKTIKFLEDNPLLREVLEQLENHYIVIIFGSYAKGTQKDDSDLDLFIVGDYDKQRIKKSGKRYGIDINIKSYPKHLFEEELHDDILLGEVKEHHILIQGAEAFVSRVATWIKSSGV